MIKSLRNKLRFSSENSFDEQVIALNEFSLEEPNNNLIKSTDQTSSLVNNVLSTNTKSNNVQDNLQTNGKCNTIFLSGLKNENNYTLKMDNV